MSLPRAFRRIAARNPDFVIGDDDRPYLRRWHVIPRNPLCNVYLHHFLRSDDDRALHDHPWASMSILLDGCYLEHTIDAGGIHRRRLLRPGDVRIRLSGRFAHRVEMVPRDDGITPYAWSLFITGPRYRQWGFHCPDVGWVHWQDFTSPGRPGEIGPGCGQ